MVNGMGVVKSFRELNVYRLARESTQTIFALSKKFPAEERYSLTDQIRRSSRAVKAMVAEAWAKRRYKAAFVNKIDEALAESNETQSGLDDAFDCRYLSEQQFTELNGAYSSIRSMLARMIDRADDFCKNPPSTDYRPQGERANEEEPPYGHDVLAEFFNQSPVTNHQLLS